VVEVDGAGHAFIIGGAGMRAKSSGI
jgi:hypothetical protein